MSTSTPTLVNKAKKILACIKENERTNLIRTRRAGKVLLVLKKRQRSKHRQWLPFLRKHFAESIRTAQVAMQVAKYSDYIDDLLYINPNLTTQAALRYIRAAKEAEPKPGVVASDVLRAISVVEPKWRQRSTSQPVTICDGKIIATNGSVFFSAPSPFEFEGQLSGSALMKTLGKLKHDRVSLELADDQLIVSSGTKAASINLSQEFPIEQPEDWQALPLDFAKALKTVVPFVGPFGRQIDGKLACEVQIHPRSIEASDGQRFVRYSIALPINDPFLIDLSFARKLIAVELAEIGFTSKAVWFRSRSGALMAFRKSEYNCPSTDHCPCLDRFFAIECSPFIFPGDFTSDIEFAEVATNFDKGISVSLTPGTLRIEKDRDLITRLVAYDGEEVNEENVTLLPGILSLSSERKDVGVCEEFRVKYVGPRIDAEINPKHLKEIVRQGDCHVGIEGIKATRDNVIFVTFFDKD